MRMAQFSVRCKSTRPGQSVGVAGSWTDWRASGEFSGKEYPLWKGSVELPNAGKSLEYKFVIVENGQIVTWEETPSGQNRTLSNPVDSGEDTLKVEGGAFGTEAQNGRVSAPSSNGHAIGFGGLGGEQTQSDFLDGVAASDLDAFEKALVEMNEEKKSWRLRLSFIRSAFSDPEFAEEIQFNPSSLDCLVTVATYLNFLSSGQVPCSEDNGHHRPNHHASEAQQIENALDALVPRQDREDCDEAAVTWVPYVARSIYPQLPSHASQFTVSVPLTRIRDIAHRGDIPHDMKQEIKHTLQNKIHRCCGPEDIRTCEKLLQRVENDGGYSGDFVYQLRVFYRELREFFNASSLDDRLQFLSDGAAGEAVAGSACELLRWKNEWKPAMDQLKVLTNLRTQLGIVLASNRNAKDANGKREELSSDIVQKVRLADVELDSYAFTLLAAAAKEVEEKALGSSDAWCFALRALGYGMLNMHMSHILGLETKAIASELLALTEQKTSLDYLRIKAAVDRSRRATEDFSAAISDAYTRRVASLSVALDVDRRAAAVLAEAVIRSTVAFQSSRIADAATKKVRSELGIPAWDPLRVGSATGSVVFVDSLAGIEQSTEPTVAVCRKAHGDEDIPSNVRGIVLGHALPHLSHLGVRARQSGVVFVCAEDQDIFKELWNGPSRSISGVRKLSVSSANGFDGFTAEKSGASESVEAHSVLSDSWKGKPSVDIGSADVSDEDVLPLTGATKANASAKCTFAGRLAGVAEKSGMFVAPGGACLPFGLYKAAECPHDAQLEKLISKYDSAAVSGDASAAASTSAEVRSFIESNFQVSDSVVSAIQKALPEKDSPVMVRSSANCEDLEDMSGAGLYDSIANVSPSNARELAEAVQRVWSSLWTQRAASSRTAYDVPHRKAYMAVLVQQMVHAEVSFVAFSHNPVGESDRSSVYIELAVGMGETLASAASAGQPYRIRVDRETPSSVTVDALASFGCALVPTSPNAKKDSTAGLRRKIVDYSSERLTVDGDFRSAIATRIALVMLKLEEEFGGPQDVEGAITGVVSTTAAESANLYIVQARPQIL